MPKGLFLTKLRVEDYNGDEEWVLIADLVYETSTGNLIAAVVPLSRDVIEQGQLVSRPSWTWNGASIPRFFWRVFGSPFVGRHRKPSVIHDYLWSMAKTLAAEPGVTIYTYRYANAVFYDALLSQSVWVVKAWLMWLGTAFKASYQKGGWA